MQARDQGSAAVVFVAGAAGVVLILVAVLTGVTRSVDESGASCLVQPGTSGAARTGIPARYLRLYQNAGRRYGIRWDVLAGIGKIETDHGRSNLPGVHSGENFAGAGGPMQFLAPTWRSYGVDGNDDGIKNRYDPADAIPGAANYLKASGAPDRLEKAIYAYNHSHEYVQSVLTWARRYASGVTAIADPSGCDGTGGLPPAPNAVAAKMVRFAMAQVGKRYVYGGNGPDVWDCSGLTHGIYRHVGLTIPRTSWAQWAFGRRIPAGQEQPGDLVFFMNSPDTGGPNKPGHVAFIVGNGMTVNARCTTCRPGVAYITYRNRKDIRGFTRPLPRSGSSETDTPLDDTRGEEDHITGAQRDRWALVGRSQPAHLPRLAPKARRTRMSDEPL